jgi:DNA modification methylase
MMRAMDPTEAVPLARLTPAPWNPRTITDKRFKDLCRSLADDPEFLWHRPVLAQADGTIYAGNMRYRAAEHLGMTTVPAIIADVPPKLARERALRDNHQWGEWEDAALAELIYDLTEGGTDPTTLGFDEAELARLIDMVNGKGGLPGADPDDIPATVEPQAKRGDVYVLGEHRVMCGDATSADDVARLLAGTVPFLCVTDPPYGVSYDPAWRKRAAEEGHLAYAACRIGEVTNDDRSDWREAWELFPGDVLYSWHPAGATSLVHAAALQDSGFVLRMQIIWAKSNFPIGRGDYHVQHEPCWYAVREGRAAHRTKDRTQTTLWEINLDKNVEGGHSTQKPVECMARPIRNHVAPDVYDPFLGSGTTLIACEQLGRRCYGMEIEPRYVDVAVRRWEEFTGGKAVLETADNHAALDLDDHPDRAPKRGRKTA